MNRLLKAKAIRLLQCRAGGRYNMFEAGQLYEICLALGMKDSRWGDIGDQEHFWQGQVLSCLSEKEAKQRLTMLLSTYVPLINSLKGSQK